MSELALPLDVLSSPSIINIFCISFEEEEALLSEMDVTGQAFEDMQEQNSRLLQQLREKDDANFKLMSERIKSNQIYKLLKEEKEELADQVLTFKTKLHVDNVALKTSQSLHPCGLRKLEEKEGVLQTTLAALEKELAVRTQALELNKRKAVEAAQLAEDLKVQLEHTQAKLKEIQVSVAENRTARERESSNLKRAQETVLTKCFHVFCYECLKMRYDTRQRKCPKCNCAFGANDFHRIYIT
ncbi:hypothetical protein XENOCAPTIV_024429 [Xenoophorus captivus]|uniref:E3 ubiquitin protein ligase n=1 Tax=Xenoophorus captivus TaxID=1517983 RepID=A0ABV0QJZ8_9TELE